MTRKAKGITAPFVAEKDLQRAITDMAKALGWRYHHETFSMGSRPGYPDLTLVHPQHGVLWLELKASNGTVKPSQQEWIDALNDAGLRAFIVYPHHQDLIAELLQGNDVAFPQVDQLGLWEAAS